MSNNKYITIMKKISTIILSLFVGYSVMSAQQEYFPAPIEVDGQTIQPDTLWYSVVNNSYVRIDSVQAGKYEGYIYIPDTINNLPVKSIGYAAFHSSDITFVRISNNVETISTLAFAACRNLTYIDIPNSVKTIGDIAFAQDNNLFSIYMADGVDSIGNQAFHHCAKLEAITCLSLTPPRISSNTFEEIASEARLYVPNNSIAAYRDDMKWGSFFRARGEEYVLSDTVPEDTSYRIIVVAENDKDTIGEFWFDSMGNNITDSIAARNIVRHMPMEGTKDVFKLKLKVGAGTDGKGTPSTAQKKNMPAGQNKLIVYGVEYGYIILDNNENIIKDKTSIILTDDDRDGLDIINFDNSNTVRKIMRNGQVIILTPNSEYDLQGRQIK